MIQNSQSGLVGDHDMNNVKFIAQFNGEKRAQLKPHHAFQNWTNSYKVPWVFLLELSVFFLYFLLTYYHQNTTISFSNDFTDAISDFFLDDIELEDPPEGISMGSGSLSFKEDLLSHLYTISSRFFEFPQSFPIAYPFIETQRGVMRVILHDGTQLSLDFNENQTEDVQHIAEEYIDSFYIIKLSMLYIIQVNQDIYDSRIQLYITATFTRDPSSELIFVDVSNMKTQDKQWVQKASIFISLSISLPIVICILNFIAIIMIINNLLDLYIYLKNKLKDSGQKVSTVFRKKVDSWDYFALFTHVISIFSSIFYIFKGQDIQNQLEPVFIIMSFSTLFHSLLLIRYLKINAQTMLIVNVFFNSAIKIAQFLVGCLPLYIGFLVFAICFFGHITEDYATGLHGAAFLFCVMHGDSVKKSYDDIIIQSDYSPYFGFFFTSTWIVFSLTIMYNITISIVQEVFTFETYKATHQTKEENTLPSFAILANDFHLISTKQLDF